ncbi:MAG: PTS transporter subunit EIIC, partial [Verrucomicrobiae bacterium]|nr:PTS transporter subunit EIIC [Verrucomicrobiae bacterium]
MYQTSKLAVFFNGKVAPVLTTLSENTYLSAVRSGMVSVVPLTIIGGFFVILTEFPAKGWSGLIEPYVNLLRIPVKATFGLLAVFICFSIAFDLAKQLKQEALISATIAASVFLMIQLRPGDLSFDMSGLESRGIFTAILVAIVCVRTQKWFSDKNLVIRLPRNVPAIVYESFVSLIPMFALLVLFWVVRFVAGFDINHIIQTVISPLVFALNTLPGILVYAFLVTILWSVGINGDNAMDAIVAPIFLQYLADNVNAAMAGQPLPYVTALGFFTIFVNVGGTGATIALALLMLNSKDPGYRKVSRLSLPTQFFGINEPIFFGFP